MPGDYGVRMIRRPLRALLAAVAVAAVTALAGCTTPTPDPSPTPTGFATEAEAYAAAEATYRAYVDALNRVDLSDPATFEDVYAWTTGDLNASDREGLSTYHAEGFSVSGRSVVQLAEGSRWSSSASEVVLSVCLDVASVELVNASGESQVQPDRVDVQSLTVTLFGQTSDDLRLTRTDGREGEPTC